MAERDLLADCFAESSKNYESVVLHMGAIDLLAKSIYHSEDQSGASHVTDFERRETLAKVIRYLLDQEILAQSGTFFVDLPPQHLHLYSEITNALRKMSKTTNFELPWTFQQQFFCQSPPTDCTDVDVSVPVDVEFDDAEDSDDDEKVAVEVDGSTPVDAEAPTPALASEEVAAEEVAADMKDEGGETVVLSANGGSTRSVYASNLLVFRSPVANSFNGELVQLPSRVVYMKNFNGALDLAAMLWKTDKRLVIAPKNVLRKRQPCFDSVALCLGQLSKKAHLQYRKSHQGRAPEPQTPLSLTVFFEKRAAFTPKSVRNTTLSASLYHSGVLQILAVCENLVWKKNTARTLKVNFNAYSKVSVPMPKRLAAWTKMFKKNFLPAPDTDDFGCLNIKQMRRVINSYTRQCVVVQPTASEKVQRSKTGIKSAQQIVPRLAHFISTYCGVAPETFSDPPMYARTQFVKNLSVYINEHGLTDKTAKTNIIPDEPLKELFQISGPDIIVDGEPAKLDYFNMHRLLNDMFIPKPGASKAKKSKKSKKPKKVTKADIEAIHADAIAVQTEAAAEAVAATEVATA